MRLQRVAQVLAGLSLVSLGAGAWLEAALSTTSPRFYTIGWNPGMVLGSLLNLLFAGCNSLALAGAVLQLSLLWQARRRVWSATLLVITLLLVGTQDSAWHMRVASFMLLQVANLPPPVSFAVVFSAPSALLAVAVLGCSALADRATRRQALPAADDSSLELRVESLRTPMAD